MCIHVNYDAIFSLSMISSISLFIFCVVIKLGDNTDKYCQAYFSYDSKKSGGFTCSHLRFGDTPIRSTYLVTTPNFVACHVQAYLHMYDVTRGLQKNGQFLLNTIFEGEELANFMPNKVKRYFAQKGGPAILPRENRGDRSIDSSAKNKSAGSRADILGLGFPPLRFSYIYIIGCPSWRFFSCPFGLRRFPVRRGCSNVLTVGSVEDGTEG